MAINFDFIDLFAGIGGFHLGMAANGGRCVFANEWNKYSAATYTAWYGQEVNTEDLRTLDFSTTVPDHDVLCAGFPCQPFSIAGVSKKNALGRAHGFRDVEQGNLFFAICDLAVAKRPPVMILENVKNLRAHDKGHTWQVITESLDTLGYEVLSSVIDAQGWVPQHRERVFIVCFDRTKFTGAEIASFQFPRPSGEVHMLADILDPEPPAPKYMLTDGLWSYLQRYAEKHQARGNGFGFGLARLDGITRTLSARYYKDGSEILIPQPGWRNPRRLTPAEAAKLMGFTASVAKRAGYGGAFPQVVSDTQAYKQYGNSVSPLLTEAVGKSVLKVLRKRSRRLREFSRAHS